MNQVKYIMKLVNEHLLIMLKTKGERGTFQNIKNLTAKYHKDETVKEKVKRIHSEHWVTEVYRKK